MTGDQLEVERRRISSTSKTTSMVRLRFLFCAEQSLIHLNLIGRKSIIIELHTNIYQTKQNSRLRGLKQLGNTHYVYPAAKHTRWEHSLGVMHLAGEMMDHLMKRRPGCADETDKICVMMAGLCHDLGHGPFR